MKHLCVTDRHDMTLAVKLALKPNTTNNPLILLYQKLNTFTDYGSAQYFFE